MKPKNKFQQHVVELGKRLPRITEPQQRWTYKHCFDHIGKRNAKGTITCLEYGHSWQGDNIPLVDTVLGCKCPRCATQLEIKHLTESVQRD